MARYLPAPPTDRIVSDSSQLIMTVVQWTLLTLCLIAAIWYWHKKKDSLAFLVLLGGVISSIWEPPLDVLGAIYHYEKGQWTAFAFLGRGIPVWIPPLYGWFVGGLAFLTYEFYKRQDAKGADLGKLSWKIFAAVAVLQYPTVDQLGIMLGLHTYYGHQPLNPTGFPLHGAVINGTLPVVGGAMLFALRPYLVGAKKLLVLWLVPCIFAFTYAFAGPPTWVTLNSEANQFWVQLSGVSAIGFSLMTVWLANIIVRERSNANRRAERDEQSASPEPLSVTGSDGVPP
jgi:hypothetical protein